MTNANSNQVELLEANKIVIKGKEYSVLQGKNGGSSIFIKSKRFNMWCQFGSIKAEETPFNTVLTALQTWHKCKQNKLSPIKGVFNPVLEEQDKEIKR